MRLVLLVSICAFVIVAAIWGWFGQVDVIASAQGEIIPVGGVKAIKPAAPGKVARILAQDGAHVCAGEPLLELDAADARADVAADAADLQAYDAESARRIAGIAAAESGRAPAIAGPAATPEALRARESEVLDADLTQLAGERAGLQAQIDQKQAEQERLQAQIAVQKALVATESERLAMKTQLLKEAAGSKADVISATETLQEQETTLVQEQDELRESRAAQNVVAQDLKKPERRSSRITQIN